MTTKYALRAEGPIGARAGEARYAASKRRADFGWGGAIPARGSRA